MRRLIIAMIVLATACDKDDEPRKYTSIQGYWIVDTPDDATSVTFRIDKDPDGVYQISEALVRHNGTNYDSSPVDAAINVISETQIESVTIVTMSTQVPYFVIRFQEISVNQSFTEMQINISSFNVDGTFREFPMIVAVR